MTRSKLNTKFHALLGVIFLLTSCLQEDEVSSLIPEITEISPQTGMSGDEVIIAGKNFNETLSQNEVQFNGIEAQIVSGSETTLTVLVPEEATTGKITVVSNEKTATSAIEFTVLHLPVLASFSPTEGFEGDEVVLSGEKFNETLSENEVKFNGISAAIVSATESKLTVTVPENTTSGRITVTVNEQTVISASDFKVLHTPVITSFSPSEGYEGYEVEIFGENFSDVIEENEVKFNGKIASIKSATSTKLVVEVPAEITSGKITVSVNELLATTETDFTVLHSPTIETVTPLTGVVGTEVAITGANFSEVAGENIVKFGGVLATVNSFNEQMITVNVPFEATTSRVSVEVKSKQVEFPDEFVLLAPEVTNFSPAIAGPGEEVTITGKNFSANAASNIVSIGGVAAEIKSATGTEFIVTVPQGDGAGKISVAIGTQSAESLEDFEYFLDIPREGLVAFYPFSAGADDESGNNLNGTVNGATLVQDRFGKDNGAYTFDGTDDYIDMGNPAALQISDKITIALWTRSSDFVKSRMLVSKTDRVDGYIFDTGELGNGDQGYSVFVYSSTASGTNWARLSDDFVANEWTFIAFTLDSSIITFYQNGEQTSRFTSGRPLTDGTTGDFQIGGGDNHFFFGGDIDDVAVYHKALTQEEITQLYNQNLTKK